MIKRFISFLTAFSMTLMLFTGMPISVSADNVHTHKVCFDSSHANCTHSENIEYEPFPTGLNVITEDKNYYLTENLTDETLLYHIFVKNATVNLCLNGKTIDTERRGFTAYYGGVLNICDCKTGGCIKNTKYTEGVVGTGKDGTLNIYSGKFCGEKGGGIATGDNSFTNIYGGEISSAEADCIWLKTGGVLSIYGGTIKSTTDNKDAIATFDSTEININGGTIIGKRYGIRFGYNNNTINVKDGIIIGTDQPAVYVKSGDTANISGGKILSENYSDCILNCGTMNISGGSFSRNANDSGYIRNYGSFSLQGSPTLINTGIWLCSDDNITIGGALTNNEAYTVYVSSDLPRTFTNGWSAYMGEKNPSDYFKSPYIFCTVEKSGGEAVMKCIEVTYNANGGVCSTQSTNVNNSGKIISLAVPAREGYSFSGWFTEESGGEQITTDTVFTNDTTIYAHWSCSDHIWGDTYEKDENQHWQICTRCNAESEKSNHTWNDGTVTTEPTEEAEGVKTYTCTVCFKTKTESIEQLTHTHTYSNEWTSDSTSHWHAATCGHDVISGEAAHIFFEGKCTVCQEPAPNYNQPTDTEPTVTEPPVTDPSDTEPTVTEPPVTEPSGTEPIVTEPPVTEPPITEPTVTAPPVTEPVITNPPYIPYFPSNNTSAVSVSKEPFLQNENGKIGWDVISDDIWETPDGETVLVNMNGTTELPKNIVSDIAGRDIDLVLIMNGGFIWTINGMSVTKAKTVDMSVRKVSKIPQSTVQEYFGDVKTVQLDLRHSGDFGFIAELTIDLGSRYDGMYANSYCYKSRKFEFGDSSEIVDGQAKLRFAHASSWLITVESSPILEDVSSGAAAHSSGTPIDMSNPASRGITVPDFDFEKKFRISNKKRRYRILKKRRLDDLVFVY